MIHSIIDRHCFRITNTFTLYPLIYPPSRDPRSLTSKHRIQIMVTRVTKHVGLSTLALLGTVLPNCANAQFGVAGNRRKGGAASSFEELNKMAADRMASEKANGNIGGGLDDLLGGLDLNGLGLDGMDLGALMKDLDPNTLQDLIMEGMKDPQIQQMFSGMQGAMDELLKMDSAQLKAQMEEAMAMLTSSDMQQNIIDQKDAVLAMMEAQGTATPEEIAEYRADPKKFEQAMSQAFGQMQEIFSDPKALDTVVQMVKGFSEIISDPSAAMSKLGGVLQEALADDDKIEEARMQLLSDPTVAGNKALSEMFSTEEMMEILNDPIKWKKTVKEGQKMLMGQGNDGKGGVGMGEL